jgi:hypothetical protein
VLSVIDWVRVGEKAGKIPQNPFLAIYAMWLVKGVMKSKQEYNAFAVDE